MFARIQRTFLIVIALLALVACTNASQDHADDPFPVLSPTPETPPGETAAAPDTAQPTDAGVDPTAEPTTALPPGTPPPTATPPPTPIPAPYQGLSIMGVELIGPNFASRSNIAATGGAYWVRWNGIFWSDVEPNQGDRIWKALLGFEQQVLTLNANNLKLIAVVRSTPLWAQANAGDFCGPVAEGALDDFGTFMFDLVSKYSVEPFNIKYWEIGNEPDVDARFVDGGSNFGCWGSENAEFYGAAVYARMLREVYPRIKAADPDAQVLVGGLLLDCDPANPPETQPGSGIAKDCTPATYLEGILVNGGGDFFDGVSFHAYDYYDPTSGLFGNPNWNTGYLQDRGLTPVVVPKARYLRAVLTKYGYFDKYLLNTETALLCGKIGNEPDCGTSTFHKMKADYAAMVYAAAFAEGLQGNIWFTLDNPWRSTNLTSPEASPYPAYYAYQLISHKLSGATFRGQIAEYPGVTGYKFRKDGADFWIIWSLDAAPHSVTLPSMPVLISNSTGAPQTVSQTITVGTSPVYLDFQP